MKTGRNSDQVNYLRGFFDRHSMKSLRDILDSAESLKVLVIGEAVIDEYVYGEVLGKTNKSPSLVFGPHETEVFAGVPMNVANHLSTFCGQVDLSIMVGRDGLEDFITSHLNNVRPSFYYWDSATISKRRYIASYNNGKVFEVYDFVPSKFDDTKLIADLISTIGEYDFVVVCDSGHGMMTYEVREVIQEGAKFLAVNTQMNAGNVGTHSVRKYMSRKHNIFICVNEREFVLATHEDWDKHNNLDDLLMSFDGNITAVTTGPSGCKIAKSGSIANVPAFTDSIVDPVGAGDAFLSLSSIMAYKQYPLDIVGFFGNVAGALKTYYQGNKEYITKDRVNKYLFELMERSKL